MTPADRIQLGERARRLLTDPLLTDAIERLRAEQIERWLEHDDPQARPLLLALDKVLGELNRHIEAAEVTAHALEKAR